VSETEREAAKSESFVSESVRVGSRGRVAEGIVGDGMVAVGGDVEVGSLAQATAEKPACTWIQEVQ